MHPRHDGAHGCIRGVTVKIQKKTARGFKMVQTAVTDDGGGFEVALRNPYGKRFRALATPFLYSPFNTCGKAVSATVRG